MRCLKIQHESNPVEVNGLMMTFGLEIFHDDAEGFYTARCHARTYDGIRVSSSHTTDAVRLESHTLGGARAEGSLLFRDFYGLYVTSD